MYRIIGFLLAFICIGGNAQAGPFEEGVDAYKAKDYKRALILWSPLAEKGNVHAQFNLGVMYANGQGVPRNEGKAFGWFGKAALESYPPAILQVGIAFYRGSGTEKNFAEALAWFHEAISNGEKDADSWIKKIHNDLFPTPLPGWRAHEVKVTSEEIELPESFKLFFDMFGKQYKVSFARDYESPASQEKLGIEITINDYEAKLWVDTLNEDQSTLAKDKLELIQRLKQGGVSRYTYNTYKGITLYDSKNKYHFKGIDLGERIFVGFGYSEGNHPLKEDLMDAYIERTNMELIHNTLTGYDYTFEPGVVLGFEKPKEFRKRLEKLLDSNLQ